MLHILAQSLPLVFGSGAIAPNLLTFVEKEDMLDRMVVEIALDNIVFAG